MRDFTRTEIWRYSSIDCRVRWF